MALTQYEKSTINDSINVEFIDTEEQKNLEPELLSEAIAHLEAVSNDPTLVDDPEFGASVQIFINPELILDLTSSRSTPKQLEERTTFGEVREYIIQCIDSIIVSVRAPAY